MTLKEARAECRRLAIKHNNYWWPLSWNKLNGYYPDGPRSSQYFICFVHKDGRFMYASKDNERKHNLKGNVRSKYD